MTNPRRNRQTALVIGCGVGGPVVAMALQKAGIDATIFEAHDKSAEFVGSFLNTASNGLDALRAIGAQDAVVARGFPTPRMVMWSGSGKRLGEVANGLELADGTVSITIERGLLHAALRREAVSRGINIEQGRRLVSADTSNHGVVARFADGTEAHGDVLIGADGLHSATRRLIDAAAPVPRYTGLLSLGGRARLPTLAPTPETFHMIFGRRAFFGYSVRASGEIYWFANVAWRENTDERHAAISPAEWKKRLLDLFASDAGPAVEIIGGTHEELAAYPVYDMPAVPTWYRDSLVIVGDAAHATSPSSGQGASLAIEDAVVLSKCLRDCRSVPEAFAAYERLRRGRVERVVAYSARIGRTKSAGPIGRWVRDLVMPLALKYLARASAQAWLYGYHVDWNEPVRE
jgi:FAD-dependent urate hydroxylase